MSGIVVLVFVAAMAGVIVWVRMTSARAERRSVDAYERRLGALGHVAKRSDAAAQVHAPTPEELARPHVRASDSVQTFRAAQRSDQTMLTPRVHLNPPVPHGKEALPVFGADELEPASAFNGADALNAHRHGRLRVRTHRMRRGHRPVVDTGATSAPLLASSDESASQLSIADAAPWRERARSTGKVRSAHGHRRALTGAVAVVAVGAIAVGSWQVANTRDQRSNGATRQHSAKSRGTANSGEGTIVEPTASSNGVVTVPAPSGPYTIQFSTVEPCWLGVEQSASTNGPWLAMETLAANGTWSRQATGSIAVRVGAPKTLTVTLNGQVVALPATTNPEDIVFQPQSAASA